MAITFQKRQKEMKRMEKQRAKAERRAQKKLVKRDSPEGSGPPVDYSQEIFGENEPLPPLDQETP
jgi:hypothetical protein